MAFNTEISLASAFSTIITERRSVRAFLPLQVPQTDMEAIFTLANHTPSNCNTQPWIVHVASGEPLAALKLAFTEALATGAFSMDFPYEGKYTGVYKERQYAAANELFTTMGIAREDKEKRNATFMRNFSCFDAPHVAFLFMHESFGLREAADVGMYAQSLMLALTAYGLGSCPQTSMGFHANSVREILGVDASHKLLFGISFGYTDTNDAANHCRTGRAALSDNTSFHQ